MRIEKDDVQKIDSINNLLVNSKAFYFQSRFYIFFSYIVFLKKKMKKNNVPREKMLIKWAINGEGVVID